MTLAMRFAGINLVSGEMQADLLYLSIATVCKSISRNY